jgi:hypothetical protein
MGWKWLPSVTIAMLCILLFTALLAPSSVGQQGSNTLLFLLGQQYTVQHQQQFSSPVYSVLQKAEPPLAADHLAGVVPYGLPQNLSATTPLSGVSSWIRQRHRYWSSLSCDGTIPT